MPDQAALITGLILERPLCVACLSAKTGLSETDLDAKLAVILAALQLHNEIGRCRDCGDVRRVFSVDRPAI